MYTKSCSKNNWDDEGSVPELSITWFCSSLADGEGNPAQLSSLVDGVERKGLQERWYLQSAGFFPPCLSAGIRSSLGACYTPWVPIRCRCSAPLLLLGCHLRATCYCSSIPLLLRKSHRYIRQRLTSYGKRCLSFVIWASLPGTFLLSA